MFAIEFAHYEHIWNVNFEYSHSYEGDYGVFLNARVLRLNFYLLKIFTYRFFFKLTKKHFDFDAHALKGCAWKIEIRSSPTPLKIS